MLEERAGKKQKSYVSIDLIQTFNYFEQIQIMNLYLCFSIIFGKTGRPTMLSPFFLEKLAGLFDNPVHNALFSELAGRGIRGMHFVSCGTQQSLIRRPQT